MHDVTLVTFTIYWKNGEKEYIQGKDLGDALNAHGYADRSVHEIYSAVAGVDDSLIWGNKVWFRKAAE